MKRVLIVGAKSYVGDSFKEYCETFYCGEFLIDILDARGLKPKAELFKSYDTIFYVAGIAHIKESEKNANLYYDVNRNLSIKVANCAKAAKVGQIIIMSTMAVYGMKEGMIRKDTEPNPCTHYGKSKLEADRAIWKLQDDEFKVAILRPPMIYGRGCKGNYQRLRKIAIEIPFFPKVKNQRSMLYIGNLCEFVVKIIIGEKSGLFFPQNGEYVNTSEMVESIAEANGKKMTLLRGFGWLNVIPINTVKKVFGTLIYERVDEISKYNFVESVKMSEIKRKASNIKKALVIASVASMLDNFNRNNIDILLSLGYKVIVAANFHTKEDINSQEKIDEFSESMREKGVQCVQIDFSRKACNIGQQIKSIKQVRNLLECQFDLVHCHSPICSVIVRKEAQKYRRQYGTKVLYTAHGFHFYDGAPYKNWIVYYPVEKWMSKYTDVLFTINKQDYERASKKFYAVKTEYIPGIGIDIEKYGNVADCRKKIRKEMGGSNDSIILLSVGELNSNKNHEIVIRALSKLPENVIYVVAGIGKLEGYLRQVARDIGVQDRVKLIGFRKDIPDVCNASDIFVFPSFREGLSVSLMEAMASGLPVACGKIRGNTDLIDEGKGGLFFNPAKIDTVVNCLLKMINNCEIKYGEYNREKIKMFSVEKVSEKMIEEYKSIT